MTQQPVSDATRRSRAVLLTEPVAQEPSGETMPETDAPDDPVLTEPVPEEPPTSG